MFVALAIREQEYHSILRKLELLPLRSFFSIDKLKPLHSIVNETFCRLA